MRGAQCVVLTAGCGPQALAAGRLSVVASTPVVGEAQNQSADDAEGDADQVEMLLGKTMPPMQGGGHDPQQRDEATGDKIAECFGRGWLRGLRAGCAVAGWFGSERVAVMLSGCRAVGGVGGGYEL